MKNAMAKIVLTTVLLVGMIFGAVNPVAAMDKETKRLVKALRSDNIGWRVSAALLLGERGDKDATKALISVLTKDRHYAARVSAAVALAKIGDPRAERALRKAARNDRELTVRTVARGAFEELRRVDERIAAKE